MNGLVVTTVTAFKSRRGGRGGMRTNLEEEAMRKREHVPETRSDPKPNREQRRHPERFAAPADEPVHGERDVQPDILKHGSDDDVSVRAKSTGHRKKTADKWNQ
jgi:hypothetical protein